MSENENLEATEATETPSAIEGEDDVEGHGLKEVVAGVAAAAAIGGGGMASMAQGADVKVAGPGGRTVAAAQADVRDAVGLAGQTAGAVADTAGDVVDGTNVSVDAAGVSATSRGTVTGARGTAANLESQVGANVDSVTGVADQLRQDTIRNTQETATNVSNTTGTTVRGVRATSATTLRSSLPSAVRGANVTFTALIGGVRGAGDLPTGEVTFYDGETKLDTVGIRNGQATMSTTKLGTGVHQIVAKYGGDARYAASDSVSLPQVIVAEPTKTAVTLVGAADSVVKGQSATFTVTVAGIGASATASTQPSGTVTFYDGQVVLGTVTLHDGQASLSVSGLTAGSHTISVNYQGVGDFADGASQLVWIA